MKPYRTSISARILSGGAAVSLLGAGLTPIAGLDATRTIPVIILITIAAGLSGILLAIRDHMRAALFAAMLLPLVMWAYVMAMIGIVHYYPAYAWALIAAAGVPLVLFIVSLGTRPEPLPARTAQHA
jgi:hypothetical protein